MSLCADIALQRGDLHVAARFDVGPGETVALLGPNGAGKSSCIAALAGLLRLEEGSITLDGRVLDGGPGVPFIEPAQRGIGVLFQDYLLFAHLSVLENVAYGPRSRGRGRRESRDVAAGWLERVGLAGLDSRTLPGNLSGGQRQRVALARALACSPRVLLLDEPLAAIDASARLALRRDLRAHLAGFDGPRILVTHEIADALALADRIVVLEEGRVVQSGTARELASRPSSRYIADLVGVNGFVGRCSAGVIAIGAARLSAPTALEGDVFVTIHPRAISLFRERPVGSPRNVWSASVEGLEPLLDRTRVRLEGELPLVAEVTHAAVMELDLRRGAAVWVAIKATEIDVAER